MTKNDVFKHPGIKAFFLYFIATQINDPLAIAPGGVPITPVQISILIGIGMTIKYWSGFVYKKLLFFYLFLAIVFIYTVVKLLNKENLELYPLTLFFNLLWVTCVSSSLLKKKVARNAYIRIFKMILIFLIPNILFGFYEFITHKNMFTEGLGGAMKDGIAEGNFYIRGGFKDKFDFSSFMIMGTIVYMVCNINNIKLSWFYKIICLSCTLLILFSFSSTVIFSLAFVIAYSLLFMGNVKRSIALVFFVCLLGLSVATYISQTSIFKTQMAAYDLKYQRQVEDKDETNFRWIAVRVGFEKFLDEPIFGYGIDDGKDVIFKYAPGISNKPTNSHNYIINNLLDFGLLGFLILTIALIKIFRLYRKIDKFRVPHKPISDLLLLLFLFNLITFQFYYHSFDRSMYFIVIFFVFYYFSSKLSNESVNMRSKALSRRGRNVGMQAGGGA